MKTNKIGLYSLLIGAGMALVIAGGLIKSEDLKAVSGILIGGGAGLFGMSLANLITLWIEARNPHYRRQVQIDSQDERNQTINHTARSRAFSAFSPIFGVLMLIYVLIGEDMLPILLLVGAYLAVYGVYIFNLNKLNKEI